MDITHFVYSLMSWWTCGWFPPFGCCVNNPAINIRASFCWTWVFIPLGYIPRSGIAGSGGNSMFNCLRSHQTLFQSGYNITFPQVLANVCVTGYSHPHVCKVVPHWSSASSSLMTNNGEHLFIGLSSLEKCTLKFIFNWVISLSLLSS